MTLRKNVRQWFTFGKRPIQSKRKARSRQPLLERLEDRTVPTGTWQNLAATNPGAGPAFEQALALLPDGTVMVQSGKNVPSNTWFRLTPDQSGNYVNGTWSSLANSGGAIGEQRLFNVSAVLPSGKLFTIGGEYANPEPFPGTAEIFDPATNSWQATSTIPTPPTGIRFASTTITGASNSSPIIITAQNVSGLVNNEVVTISGVGGNAAANGTWTISNVNTGANTFQLNGSTGNGAYTSGGTFGVSQFGDDPIETLPGGKILAGYFNDNSTYIYDPSTDTWTPTANKKLHNDRSDEETWLKLPDGSILSYDIFGSITDGKFEAQRYVPSQDKWVDASNLDSSNPPSLLSNGPPAASAALSSPQDLQGDELGPAFMLPNGNAIFFGGNGQTAIYNPTTNTWTNGGAQPTRPVGSTISGASNISGTVTGASNASPLVITTASTAGMANGDLVTISGVTGNTAANGNYFVANLTPTSFQLTNSSGNFINGNGNYAGGGTWFDAIKITAANTTGLSNGQLVTIAGINGNTAANGSWTVVNVTATSFQLVGPQGNGGYTNGGNWSSSQLSLDDAPGCIMPNGNILLGFSPLGGLSPTNGYTFPAPTYIYEFNPTTGIYTDVTPAGGISDNQDFLFMLALPTGQVLLDNQFGPGGIKIYTPDGAPQDAWRPTITSVAPNSDGTYTLTGTQLNGISEGASFGDEATMATNYPIVELKGASGDVTYARTFNWSSTALQTGTTPETVQFALPAGKQLSDFASLRVIANGIASLPDYQIGIPSFATLPEFSNVSPAVGGVNGQDYIAWRGRDNHQLNIMALNPDGSPGSKFTSSATANTSPTLATLNGQMYVAFTGENGHHELLIAPVNIDGSGNISMGTITDLGETTDESPALAALNGSLYIAWSGRGNNYLNVMQLTVSGSTITPVEPHYVTEGFPIVASPALATVGKNLYVAFVDTIQNGLNVSLLNQSSSFNIVTTLPFEETNDTPALGSIEGQLIIGWTGTDSHLNLEALNNTVNPVTPLPINGTKFTSGLTADGGLALGSDNGQVRLAHTGTDGDGTLYDMPISFIPLGAGTSIVNGVLTVNGGTVNGTIVVRKSSLGGVEIVLNGVTTDYAPGSLKAVVINAGPKDNIIDVDSTIAGVPVTVNGGAGTNAVNVASASGNLSDLAGPLTVNGGGGATSLNVDDHLDSLSELFTLTNSTLISKNSALITYSQLQDLSIKGGTGNDTLLVDSSKGLANVVNGINYDGGTGFNSMQLVQTGGDTQTSDTYRVGPNPGQGSDVIVGPTGTQTIYFQNLAPVQDNVPAMTATVNGTNASNAINYTQGPGGGIFVGNTGFVTVDNQESYEFNNKTNLVINGLAGDDTTNLNNPTTPAGLTGSITVNGGDPTASDTLIVNGIAGSNDAFVVQPTGAGSGVVSDFLKPSANNVQPPVTYSGIEQLTVVGQKADVDSLADTGTTGDDTFEVSFGSDPASGRLTGFTAGFAFTPINYAGLNDFIAPSTAFVNSAATTPIALQPSLGGNDTVVIDGTSADDTFAWDSTVIIPAVRVDTGADSHTRVFIGKISGFEDVAHTIWRALDGNDVFNVGLPVTFDIGDLRVEGGDSDQFTDTLNYTADSGAAITVDLGASMITSTATLPNPLVYSGVERVNLTASGNASTLTINGTSGADNFVYTPTGTTAGTVKGVGPTVTFTGVGSTFTIGGNGGTSDQVEIDGTAGRDSFALDAGVRTATVTAPNSTVLKPVTLAADVQILTANGVLGTDVFHVTPAPGTQFAPNNLDNLLINVIGSAVGANNILDIVTPSTNGIALDQSNVPEAGTVLVYESGKPDPNINYANIVSFQQNGSPIGGPNVMVVGPDPYEPDNTQQSAYDLGLVTTIDSLRASIFPFGDQDYYHVVAQTTGVMDFQVYYNLFSTSIFPGGGQLNAEVLDRNGNIIGNAAAGVFGARGANANGASPDGEAARVRIPVVAGQQYWLRVYGSTDGTGTPDATVINGYSFTIDDLAPPTPFNLELSRSVTGVPGAPDTGDLPTTAVNSDSGRSQFDNVTRVSTPTIYLRLGDGALLNDLPGNDATDSPPAGPITIPFTASTASPGFRVGIFDGNNTQTPLGFATPVAGFPGLYQFTTPLLANGIHHLNAQVQMVDPANPAHRSGFGPQSTTSLDLTIDTAPPTVSFGTTANGNNGLDAGSDSGVSSDAPTLIDDATNVTDPTFYGTAEANSIIKVYALDVNGSPVLIGQTVATPIDGTNADQAGRWSVQSNINLNDPNFFSFDGLRTIQVTAEDLAGNVTDPVSFQIFVDTQGPRVQSVQIDGHPAYNLFGLKPGNAAQGPTPLVFAVDVTFIDSPAREAPFNYDALDPALVAALQADPGEFFQVQGEYSGIIQIVGAAVIADDTSSGANATETIQILFATPLPDDRLTLTIKDTLTDPVGNKLDGESNANQPTSQPTFPSGDGVPGSNFMASFTVDSRPEIGVTQNGLAQLDINGDGLWDINYPDAVNRDISYTFANVTDAVFAGNFALGGNPGDGFDRLAAYGQVGGVNGKFRWLITNNAGVPVYSVVSGLQINGLPVPGPFNPTLHGPNGQLIDELALFDGNGNWYIDYNNTGNLGSTSLVVHDGLRGFPVVGDFDGNGSIDFATYQPDNKLWQFDLHPFTSPGVTTTLSWGFDGVAARPVADDMNQDGVTDIGLFVPRSKTTSNNPSTDWYFLMSNGAPAAGTINTLAHAFSSVPLGNDLSYNFGSGFLLPIVANFDPPVQPSGAPTVRLAAGGYVNVVAHAKVSAVAPGGEAGLVARRSANGQAEYWGGLVYEGGQLKAEIKRLIGGQWTTLASAATTQSSGDLAFQVVGTSLQLSMNGQVLVQAVDAQIVSGGAVGTSQSPGTIEFSATATALTQPVASLPYVGSFAAPIGTTLDAEWNQWQGSFLLQNGGMAGQGATDVATLNGIVQANVEVSAAIANLTAGAPMGLLARFTPANGNTYRADVLMQVNATKHTTTYTAEIWKRVGGIWTRLTSQPLSGFSGTGSLTFTVIGTSLRLFIQGPADATARLVAFANDGSIKSGTIGLYGARGGRFSSFAASAILPTPAALPYAEDFTAESTGSLLGNTWSPNLGTFAVSRGELLGLAANNLATLYGVSAANTDSSVSLLALAGGSVGLVSRFDPTLGNYYWGGLVSHGTYFTAEIHKVFGGKVYTVATATLTGSAAGSLRFESVGTSLKLFLNGRLIAFGNDTYLRSGSVGLSGTQGSAVGNFQASSASTSVPSLSPSFSEDFSATGDGQLSNSWATMQGNFTTANNRLTAQGQPSLAVLNGVQQTNVSLQVDLLAAPATPSAMAGLVARLNMGTGNLYWGGLNYHDGAYYAEIWKRMGGIWYRLSSAKLGTSASHTLRFDVTTAGGQQLYVDGKLVGASKDNAIAAAGTVGIYAPLNAVFDNFSATAV